MDIYIVVKPWASSYERETFSRAFPEGMRMFRESADNVGSWNKVDMFYPEDGGPGMGLSGDFVNEHLKYAGHTSKSKEYFIKKIYTQEQVDKMLQL